MDNEENTHTYFQCWMRIYPILIRAICSATVKQHLEAQIGPTYKYGKEEKMSHGRFYCMSFEYCCYYPPAAVEKCYS